jgi:Flp pilus assembly protein CpaB
MTSAAASAALFRRLRRFVLARRRMLAAVLAALAVATALQVNAAPPPPWTTVLTAARDLPPGTRVAAADLVPAAFAPASVPDGVLTLGEAVGRTTVGPVRAGEPLTDVRLLGESLLDGYPGSVLAPVRIGDAASVDLLRAGDRVTVLAADPQGDTGAVPVADAVPVVAVPPRRRSDPGLVSGALVLLAVDPTTARELAGAGATSFLSVVLVR